MKKDEKNLSEKSVHFQFVGFSIAVYLGKVKHIMIKHASVLAAPGRLNNSGLAWLELI